MRLAGWVVLVLAAHVASASEDGADSAPAEQDSSYDAQPTRVPYRSVVSGTPVPGARAVPRTPRRQYSGPAWLQRTLNVPDEPPPEPREPVPSGDIPEAQITARTIPEPPPRPAPLTDAEIVVWGDRLQQARARVTNRMTDLGYEATRTRNGRTVWEPTGAHDKWKPRVIIDDDGWFELQTPTVSGMRGQAQDGAMQPGPTNYEGPGLSYAQPLPTGGVGGQFAGKRVRQAAEARVARQVWDVVSDLSRAHQDEALIRRLQYLPDELDRLWYDGRGPDGGWYPTSYDRQKALLRLWATRTRTRAGETVRDRIGDYLVAIVDTEAGLDAELLDNAERRCGCLLFE